MNENQIEEKLKLLDQFESICTHCGICSEACATFQSTGWEHESPRGRLKLAHQFLHGKIQSHSTAMTTFDHCLGCHACEQLCPHHVPYHQVRALVQTLRSNLDLCPHSVMSKGDYLKWVRLAYRISHLSWRHYGARWIKISSLPYRSKGSFSKKQQRSSLQAPVLIPCCFQDLYQHKVIEQTIAFVKQFGIDLHVDRNQPCCGAIFERLIRGGEESVKYPAIQKKTARLQENAIEKFSKWMPQKCYFLSKGCESFVGKEGSFDLYGWIESLLDQNGVILEYATPRIVYYQPYCRLKKGQGDSILRLLKKIKGLTVLEISNPLACCGGYCGEVVLHPENAQEMALTKLSNLPQEATLVVTSPDCWGLFAAHAKDQLKICYPIEVLAEAEWKMDEMDNRPHRPHGRNR